MKKERIRLKNKTACGCSCACMSILGHVWCMCMPVLVHTCKPGVGGICVSWEYSQTHPWAECKHQSYGHHHRLGHSSCKHCQQGKKACWNLWKSWGLELGWQGAWPFLLPWAPKDSGNPLVRVCEPQTDWCGTGTFQICFQWGDKGSLGHLNVPHSMHRCCLKCVHFHVNLLRDFYRLRGRNHWNQLSSPLLP